MQQISVFIMGKNKTYYDYLNLINIITFENILKSGSGGTCLYSQYLRVRDSQVSEFFVSMVNTASYRVTGWLGIHRKTMLQKKTLKIQKWMYGGPGLRRSANNDVINLDILENQVITLEASSSCTNSSYDERLIHHETAL